MISISLWFKLVYGMLADIYACFRIATLPTLKAIWNDPAMISRPRQISQTFMNFSWGPFGDGLDEKARAYKERLVTPWASGVVFELGAGHGSLTKYLDRTRIISYIALEPNANMHERLRAKAQEFGFEEEKGSFLLLPYGVEEVEKIGDALEEWARKYGQEVKDGKTVDTIVSILALCSVPHHPSSLRTTRSTIPIASTPPAEVVCALQSRILKPGGQLLFYEHVRSPISSVAHAQDLLVPVWSMFFDGCVIGRDSVRAVWEAGFEDDDFCSGRVQDLQKGYSDWTEKGGVKYWKSDNEKECGWAEMYVWSKSGEDDDPASLLWYQLGRCVKSA